MLIESWNLCSNANLKLLLSLPYFDAIAQQTLMIRILTFYWKRDQHQKKLATNWTFILWGTLQNKFMKYLAGNLFSTGSKIKFWYLIYLWKEKDSIRNSVLSFIVHEIHFTAVLTFQWCNFHFRVSNNRQNGCGKIKFTFCVLRPNLRMW